ncbi:MAG: GIY-YIG nuclease family protein [Patescibacteria group bacterium]|nr:GIY-YIG nuclease family protein [Patescibacteria group bacterium]
MDTKKPYYVYVIRSENSRHYIGLSENTEERVEEHNLGLSNWTSRYKNWKIIYKRKFDSLTEARRWENYLKRQKGGNGFKKIIGRNVKNREDGP